MIATLLTILAVVSAFLFPWPLTLVLALISAISEPLVPLAVGMLIDTLYYSGGWPLGTILGALATSIALFIHSRLRTGSGRER